MKIILSILVLILNSCIVTYISTDNDKIRFSEGNNIYINGKLYENVIYINKVDINDSIIGYYS